jgi:hypothetical protein
MKKENFFPKVTVEDNKLIFNSEAIETMELDTEDARVVVIETTNVEKVKQPKEILIMKTNGSLCDDPENVKDAFNPDKVYKMTVNTKDGEIISGHITLNKEAIDVIKADMGNDKTEFKLLVCNNESTLGKEFKEQFDITNNYYRLAYLNDKRTSVGKDKNVKESIEERISIN